jgi:uncharacterized membrane protein YphA (DoxX/SURF4 family)
MLLTLLIMCAVLALVLVWVSLSMNRDLEPGQATGWGIGTRYFLVLLRLAIGWHFLVEGLDKLNSPSWTSEAYLREATGPLAPLFRDLAGDELMARLTIGPDGELPKPLADGWAGYFDAFTTHYAVEGEQLKRARTILEQNESKARTWLTSETKLISKPVPQGPPVVVPMTIPQRIEYLRVKEAEADNIEANYRSNFGRGAFPGLRQARAEAKQIRAELRVDLDRRTADFKKALEDVLESSQKASGPVPVPIRYPWVWTRLEWADHLVKYGLLAVGGCLLGGLLTRTACVGGAGFLLLFFLAMPPLPGWPENPRAEGHYLFINKNIIEMLALLALATTRSGRWAGLDGLCQLCCVRRQAPVAATGRLLDTDSQEPSGQHPPGELPTDGRGLEEIAPGPFPSLPKENPHGP